MGWTYQTAGYYKNGKIDRKAECDALWNDDKCFKVEKSSMVGSTYYAAVRMIAKRIDGKIEELPASEQKVFATVTLTSTNGDRVFNFGYKEMGESCNPYYYDCPKSILDLLTPTESEWANEWRKTCRERAAQKRAERKNPDSLENLPIGSVIECKGKQLVKHSPAYQFKRAFWMYLDEFKYSNKNYIKRNGYTVVSRPATA
jgi:hypothetical protein